MYSGQMRNAKGNIPLKHFIYTCHNLEKVVHNLCTDEAIWRNVKSATVLLLLLLLLFESDNINYGRH